MPVPEKRKPVIELLKDAAKAINDLDQQMSPLGWTAWRTGGCVGDRPESFFVDTGFDEWLATPKLEAASVTSEYAPDLDENIESFGYPNSVYRRIHVDGGGITQCRNSLHEWASLFRLAVAEIDRLSEEIKSIKDRQ